MPQPWLGPAGSCTLGQQAAQCGDNDFCATAPGGRPYPLGENNPYENGTPLDNPVLKGH